MAITKARASSLRKYIDALESDTGEASEALYELEAPPETPDDRDDQEAMVESAIEGLAMTLADFRAAFNKARG